MIDVELYNSWCAAIRSIQKYAEVYIKSPI